MLKRSVITHGGCVVFLCSPAQPFVREGGPWCLWHESDSLLTRHDVLAQLFRGSLCTGLRRTQACAGPRKAATPQARLLLGEHRGACADAVPARALAQHLLQPRAAPAPGARRCRVAAPRAALAGGARAHPPPVPPQQPGHARPGHAPRRRPEQQGQRGRSSRSCAPGGCCASGRCGGWCSAVCSSGAVRGGRSGCRAENPAG